nr:hypothetical protein Iba_chr13bCG7060 [Ipomoea batatas]
MEIVPEIQAGQFGNTTTTWGNPRIEEDRTVSPTTAMSSRARETPTTPCSSSLWLFQETVVFVVRLKGLCGLSLGVEAGGRRSDDGRDGWRAETTAGHGSGVGKRKTAGIPGRIG